VAAATPQLQGIDPADRDTAAPAVAHRRLAACPIAFCSVALILCVLKQG